ncbi:unnamed protein product [Pleuronectes platessa]|uniref:Uncharacterized protein n=1 Tax=Pleuronectes platessa TaxID=8262 RepID=A0A9N7U2B6_PLEPL|nr:unnamed protein product [Pleuronectes platessa]
MREAVWLWVDPGACKECLLWGADAENPHLYSLLRGTSHQPHPPTGTWGAVGLLGDPAASKRLLVWVVDVGEGALTAEASLSSLLRGTSHLQFRLCRSLQSLSRAGGSQQTPLWFRHWRASQVPAPVPVPRRRVPADTTLVPASEVLAVHAPFPALIRVPRRRVPADAILVPGAYLLSLRTLPLSGHGAAIPSLRTLPLSGHGAANPSLRTRPLSGHGSSLPSLRTLPLSGHGATFLCLRTMSLRDRAT